MKFKILLIFVLSHCVCEVTSQSRSSNSFEKFINTDSISKIRFFNNSIALFPVREYELPLFCKWEHKLCLRYNFLPSFRLGNLSMSNELEYGNTLNRSIYK
ncbi:MAG: hypothetical protein HOP11_11250 [Saprospiraceae bacterium]|nr:hypothetical protein [Saprospiraceae bacterium]